jgi:demethylmenaquinone methyltransferase/2-methoxy-6-polyprenyl-1,4-benzoquinol methylase
VLRPGARLAILEFGFPRIPGIRTLYTWYFKYLLPRVGQAVSKHGDAYAYLPASVAEFPSDEGFADLVRRAGFTSVRYIPLSFGIVYLYLATRGDRT